MKKSSSIFDKWGEKSCSLGWVSIPTLLLFSQKELNINASEFNVIINLISHWWDKDQAPFPSQKAIAYRTGLSLKTVQRSLATLEDKELIKKTYTLRSDKKTKGRILYDLTPLVDKLDKVSDNIIHEMKERKTMVSYYEYSRNY